MPPKKSGRPARPAPAGRPTRPARPQQKPQRKASQQKASAQKASARSGARPTRREPAGEVVLGTIPAASRLVGAVGVVGGLLLALAVLLPQLEVGGERVLLGASFATVLVSWIWPLVVVVAGGSVVLGRYPRFGMASLGVAGAFSLAGLLGELYWASAAAARGRYEIISGQRLLTSEVERLAGWYVSVAGLIVLIGVGLAVAWLWSRVVMDDSESLDPGRPLLGGLAAITGVGAVLSLGATLVQVPDQVNLTQQPIAGQLRPVEVRVPVEGTVGLFDRPGLALTAGLILGVLLVLFAVFATTLRPRLAVVGALAAFSGYVVALAARALVEAARSDQIEATLGAWGLLVVGVADIGLTLLAWRWHPPVRPVSRSMPMRSASRRALKKGIM